MQNDITPHKSLPMPFQGNTLLDDVNRLRDALVAIDTLLEQAATLDDINSAIQALVNGAPDALNQINELAAALGEDPNFASTIMTALAGKLPNAPATGSTLGGIKVGAGLTVAGDGTLSVNGAGGGSGLPAYEDQPAIPSTNGQTVFSVPGGYTAGQIDVILNGVFLFGNGDDFTAANGTTVTLTQGVNTTDTLYFRKWKYLPIENAVNKTGDTMAGPLALAADPTTPMQASTKQYVDALKTYVDNLVAGLKFKTSVKAATTANIALTGLQTIDGIILAANDRVLVKNQTTTAQNGIYAAAAGAWTRVSDADSWVELVSAVVLVEQGATLADTGWVCTVDQGGVVGTNAVTFVKFIGGFVTSSQVMALANLPVSLVGTNTAAAAFNHYVFTAGGVTLTLPASPVAGDRVRITNASGVNTPIVDFGSAKLRGQSPGAMTMDVPTVDVQYSGNSTYGWV